MQQQSIRFIHCTYQENAATILEIFNEAIANSTALYDYQPRPPESMDAWFKAKQLGNFPVIGAIDDAGRLLGFASYGTFRAWPAYKYSVEHSVYIHKDHRGRGLGAVLLQRLIEIAGEQQYHTLIGAIDVSNVASIALHTKLGFVHTGTIAEAAFKFGRWLDLGFYQLLLATPAQPVDG